MTVGYLDTRKHALWPALTVEQLEEHVNAAQRSEIICGKCRTVSPIDFGRLVPDCSTPDMRVVDALTDYSCGKCDAGVWDMIIRCDNVGVFERTWVPEEVNWDVVVD